jgi:peptidyl-dipeptidase Dcp
MLSTIRLSSRLTVPLLLFLAAAPSQSVPVSEEPMHHRKFENEYVRIYDVVVPPHGQTLVHVHEHDYIFVALGDSHVRSEPSGGNAVELVLKNGEARFTSAPLTHRAVNLADTPFHNLTIEILKPADSPLGPLPASPGRSLVLDNDRVRISRLILRPGESTGLHTHAPAILGICVSPARLEVTAPGQEPRVVQFEAGQFVWRDKPEQHSLRNVGGTTFEAVDIEWKGAAESNPFFEPSPLPFQAPPFDRIKDSDYAPAMEEGMKRQLAEIEAIANDSASPTFANTLEAMERSGDLLTRVTKVFFNLAESNTDPAMQKVRAEEAPKLAAHADTIYLNPKLFARIKPLYDRRDSLGLDAESRYLLERYYRTFVRAGAELSEKDKTELKALNQEEATLTTKFAELLLAGRNGSALVVADKADLAGLTEGDVASAAKTAEERGLTGKWVLPLQNTTQQPALASLENRAVRKRLLEASESRGDSGGPNDTRAIVVRLAELRARKATLLGFSSYAAYVLDDQMAKTPGTAEKLMTDIVPAAAAKARGEAARMQKLIDAQKGGFELSASDWEFYAERVRRAEFELDASQIKPYLELDRVLQDGVFFAANKLYGITFRERKDIPVYHPDVRVFEVFDADGRSLALYYGDYFARPSKSGGAWEDSFVDQSSLLGTKPAVVTVLNLQKPAPGQPCLLSFDDITGLFHEFGHALHGIFSNIRYPTLDTTPRDFVEMPSQFNEHWALEPTVFAHYARHYQSGEPMPSALAEKIRKAKTFNQGYATTEYLAAALLDLSWHGLPAGAPVQSVDAFEKSSLERFHVDLAQVPPRYRTTYFSHIWDGGYAAGYYAYLWSAVLDDDAYAWFVENGGMTRANGQRFREMILSRAGSEDAAVMYRAFRGRDPVVEPLLKERGLVASAAGTP